MNTLHSHLHPFTMYTQEVWNCTTFNITTIQTALKEKVKVSLEKLFVPKWWAWETKERVESLLKHTHERESKTIQSSAKKLSRSFTLRKLIIHFHNVSLSLIRSSQNVYDDIKAAKREGNGKSIRIRKFIRNSRKWSAKKLT